MDAIKSWAFTVCLTGIAVTVIQLIIPNGKMEKTLKIAVRIFFLSALISPLVSDFNFMNTLQADFEFETAEYTQQFQENMNSMINEELSEQLSLIIKDQLSETGVNASTVDVQMRFDENNTAEITEVTVVLDEKYKIKETDIKYKIAAITDCTIRLIYTEGD